MLILRSPGFERLPGLRPDRFRRPRRRIALPPTMRCAAAQPAAMPDFPRSSSTPPTSPSSSASPISPSAAPAPALTLEHSFNMDDTRGGVLGIGWSFSLGDSHHHRSRWQPGPAPRIGTHRPLRHRRRIHRALPRHQHHRLADPRRRRHLHPAHRRLLHLARIFSADGKLLSIQDGATVRVSLDYDSSGHLSAAHYRGKLITFATDTERPHHFHQGRRRPLGKFYLQRRRPPRPADQCRWAVSTAYQYDAAGNLTSIAWAGGKTAIAYTGDPGFLERGPVSPLPMARSASTTSRTRPSEIRVTDGNGDATCYTSTALGLLQTVADAAGNTVTYAYDAAGNRIRAVNGAGETVSFTYDSRNNLTGITDGANNRWSADLHHRRTGAHHRSQQERLDPDLRRQRQPRRRDRPPDRRHRWPRAMPPDRSSRSPTPRATPAATSTTPMACSPASPTRSATSGPTTTMAPRARPPAPIPPAPP